jgi:cobalt-zinc-cadmium efflux system outer membrane protein
MAILDRAIIDRVEGGTEKRTRSKSMNRNAMRLGALALIAVAATGCASLPADNGFADVQGEISERTGQRVHWNNGTQDDEAVAKAVRELLSKTLTADAAVQVALLNNSRLQATYEDLGVAQANLVQAGLLENPVFDAKVIVSTEGGSNMLDFGITQGFLSILYRPLRQKVAAAEFEAAKLRVAGEAMDLAAKVRTVFVEGQAAAQMLEMQREIVDGTRAAYEVARSMHEAGNVTDLDLANQRAVFESARLDLASAEAALRRGRERLNSLMGLWGANTRWEMATRLPRVSSDEIDLEHLEQRAIERSLDLAVVSSEIDALATRLGIANKTALLPDLEAGLASEREEGEWKRGPIVAFPLPVFDRGQGRVAAAESMLRRKQQQYAALAVEIRSAVRAAREQLLAARDRVRHFEGTVLPLREGIVNQTLLQYNAMQTGVYQLLFAQQQQVAAGRQYIAALRDYWLARASLQQILNGRMVDIAAGGDSGMTAAAMPAETGGH